MRLISSLLPPLACHQCTADLIVFIRLSLKRLQLKFDFGIINCTVTLTASQPRDSFHNATRVASAPIVIPPFDSPELLLRPLLCTTVIRNAVTHVTDLCHRLTVIYQTVRDHTMCCSCITLCVPYFFTPLMFSFLCILTDLRLRLLLGAAFVRISCRITAPDSRDEKVQRQ